MRRDTGSRPQLTATACGQASGYAVDCSGSQQQNRWRRTLMPSNRERSLRHDLDEKLVAPRSPALFWRTFTMPQPGFFFCAAGQPAPGELLRSTPFGRIVFANSDLTGIMDRRASIQEAHRTVGQIVERVSA